MTAATSLPALDRSAAELTGLLARLQPGPQALDQLRPLPARRGMDHGKVTARTVTLLMQHFQKLKVPGYRGTLPMQHFAETQ